jgi:ASC-1-like (ASCH) protein
MDHLAILNKKLNFLPKIVSGQKTIESRWYTARRTPWHKINVGDEIYFKNTGEPVTAKATVTNIHYYKELTPEKIKKIIHKYKDILGLEEEESFYERVKDKKYAVLVNLVNPMTIPPFNISKKGYGAMSAWLTVKKITTLIQA